MLLSLGAKISHLTGDFGGPEGTRTPDPLHAMQVRYQLRHRPDVATKTTRSHYYIRPAARIRVNPRWLVRSG